MARRRKSGRKPQRPDDYFLAGPFEFARFGKTIIGRSRATPEQFAEIQKRMADSYPQLVADIDALAASVAEQVCRLPPRELLKRGWWEFAAAMIGLGGKVSESDQLMAMRMVDYVQSVIAAVPPAGAYAEQITEEDWGKLRSDVETLFQRLTLEYQSCLTAYRRAHDPALDMEVEEFRMRAETLWINIRGKRYHVHESQALLDLLEPHSDELVKLYGIDVHELVAQLGNILSKLTRGLHDAFEEFSKFQDETLKRLEELAAVAAPDATIEDLRDQLFEDKELANRRDKAMGEIFGLDLFSVAKNTTLPAALVEDLTWKPGQETEFFAPGDFVGWPLRIWPVMRRPFIELDGQAHCFDMFSLFDNIYRVLRRAIVARDPAYSKDWNDRQKAVSEELPFKYLTRLLPGATTYSPVYYHWKADDEPLKWYEADGLVIYDDHLIVIEVKAGAFTYTSPANDLAAHLASLKNLLEAPVRQGSRFVDYLESADEVPIGDDQHNEIGRLRKSDFRHVTVCTVTLDAFTELAARAQHLAKVGIDVGNRGIWPVSVDDLRVYAEIFTNPLEFLHFIEQRVRAGRSDDVDLLDEMDHLGLYLDQNNYSQFASELKGSNKLTRVNFDGFRSPIDEYFRALNQGDEAKLPRQNMPTEIASIVEWLPQTEGQAHRSELVAYFLDASGEVRDQLAEFISTAKKENRDLKRARPLSLYGGMAATIYAWSPAAPRLKDEAILHTRAVLLANDEQERLLVELEYADNDSIVGASLSHVTLNGVDETEMERIREASARLFKRRFEQAKAKGKIGRNDACPCGSGKKYKRCHGH
jgi:preprotein translocase subunit SecA